MNTLLNKTVENLNLLLQENPSSINELFNFRVECKDTELLDSSTFTFLKCSDGSMLLGALGLLNGIFEGDLIMQTDEAYNVTRFMTRKELEKEREQPITS